jgi:pimeloyl-ACP methyl ester carboxylesterase
MKIIKTLTLCCLILLTHFTYSQKPFIKGQKNETVEIDGQKFAKIVGYIEVPENKDKPNGKRLILPVHIIKSKNKKPLEPIFWLAGGPGFSNLMKRTFSQFLNNHDFVMVGYRGADGNSVLKSKKVSHAIKGINGKLLSDESIDITIKVVQEYLASIVKKGYDISQYTMIDVIEDIEYVREALGYDIINLYSVSYGTRIALLYGYKYPSNINRSVMVGANPPGHFIWYPDKTEQLLDKYDSLYKIQNLPGSIKEAMKKSFINMPKRWRGLKLDPDKIKAAAFSFMYDIDAATMVFDAFFKASDKSDYSGLYLAQLFFDVGMTKNNLWGDMFAKGFSADLNANTNYKEWLRTYNETTTLGPNMSLLLWGLSDGLTPHLIEEEYRKIQISNVQTLILSGNLDNSTPADFAAEKLVPSLPNGHQVILKDYSHSMTNGLQKEEIREMMAHYFKTGLVDTSNLSYQPINFTPKESITRMAKRKYLLWVIMSWIY